MRFSTTAKSSSHSLPSPDGAFVATILPAVLSIRSTRSLEITRTIALPPELAASIICFLWSESSRRILLASSDNIRVYAPLHPKFKVNISNPASGTVNISYICFGATDTEICVFADFGLKLIIFNLLTARSVNITSPKFFTAATAGKGLCYRPGSRNLTLLTRSGGKDIISIHSRETVEVWRSWVSETVDAQAITWSPDGKWLAVYESSGQGHKALFYTVDGYLYKVWNGPAPTLEERDPDLGAGIKLTEWSSTGLLVAFGDYSRRITLLAAPSFSQSMIFHHPISVKPTEQLQIWHEQIGSSQNTRRFMRASLLTCPPTAVTPPTADGNPKTGTNLMTFDQSGIILASRIDDLPTSVWIWDVHGKALRTLLVLHAPVAKLSWHPSIPGLLMIRCEGEESKAIVHLWRLSWPAPKIVNFEQQLPGGKIIGKSIVRWLNFEAKSPVMFFSDSQDFLLTSISDLGDQDKLPWQESSKRSVGSYKKEDKSMPHIVGMNKEGLCKRGVNTGSAHDDTAVLGVSDSSEETEEVEDTFQFRKFVEPREAGA